MISSIKKKDRLYLYSDNIIYNYIYTYLVSGIADIVGTHGGVTLREMKSSQLIPMHHSLVFTRDHLIRLEASFSSN